LKNAGFYEMTGAGKGSHRKYLHERYAGAITLGGKLGQDAKQYQENNWGQSNITGIIIAY